MCMIGAFICGVILGPSVGVASHPYAVVVRAYWDLHVWHHREALHLTKFADLFGLSVSFSSDKERAGLMAAVGTVALGLRQR